MSTIRPAAIAGTFYSDDRSVLATNIDDMLASSSPIDAEVPKVIIAPHAGHVYSGQVAAEAYSRLRGAAGRIRRVVLLGPSHRVGFKGVALSSRTAFETPLGQIPIDTAGQQRVLALPGTGFLDEAHAEEHSLEVHLPFLQRLLPDFSLIPLVVGDASREQVSAIIDALWGEEDTVIIISTDLSHFHSYDEARKIDGRTAQKILNLDASLVGEEACGCRPLNGLLYNLKQRGLTIDQVDVKNSGDTAGSRDRVVGYGAFTVVERSARPVYSLADRQRLIQVAREAVLRSLEKPGQYQIDPAHFPDHLKAERATFVTLNIDGKLRGCIGSLNAHRPLMLDVASNAQSAAFKDPRFSPLTMAEYMKTDFHISVLSPPVDSPVESREALIERLRPGIDGLILIEGGKQATYLPSVWEQLPTPELFVSELRKKAGLPAPGWSDQMRVLTYTTEEFC